MANQEHVERLLRSVLEWNHWRSAYPHIHPHLKMAELSHANLDRANLSHANLSHANLSGTDLSGADLSGATLSGATLSSANLYAADIRGAYLNRAELSGANLSHANLRDTNLSHANLRDTNLSHANLFHADLRESNLNGAKLNYADLRTANLSNAKLNSADLSGTDLRLAYLIEADLSGAVLRATVLASANLLYADLSRADLSDANLSGANLREAKANKASLFGTILASLDLSTMIGLIEIIHNGPSHIELHSVALPQDGSAIHFLRGAGVPDVYIDLYRAQNMHPIQYHSLFISYASSDQDLATRLHNDLQAHGVRCWFAPEDMKIGDKIRSRIDEAIHLQEKLLLLLSEAAIESPWVETEVEAALEKERQQHREILFPIRLDNSVMHTTEAWAKHIRQRRHIGDFSDWKNHDTYKKAFIRLLRDLKQTQPPGSQEKPS